MKRLIVNADDFGLAESVNLGIIKGHAEGIVTSATLLACCDAAGHASELAKGYPKLGVGVHLCLTRERPVLDPKHIPTITKGGAFLPSPFSFMARLMSGQVNISEVEAELRAQIEKAISLGITPTHIDGHQHIHIMPGVINTALRLAKEYSIPSVRYPVGPWAGRTGLARAFEKIVLEGIASSRRGIIVSSGISSPDYFFGLNYTGSLDSESLCGIISCLPEGSSEIMCHPGLANRALADSTDWGHGWERELDAVCSRKVKEYVQMKKIELINYAGLRETR